MAHLKTFSSKPHGALDNKLISSKGVTIESLTSPISSFIPEDAIEGSETQHREAKPESAQITDPYGDERMSEVPPLDSSDETLGG